MIGSRMTATDPSAASPRLERPLKVTISYTHSCNLDCALCYADCGRSARPELSAAEWIAFIDRCADDGVIGFYFEGGEPLHRADFMPVVTHAARLGMTMLRTNGTLITPAVARRLKDAGVATVLVDVWGAHAESHEALTRAPGSFAASLAGVRAALDAGLDTQLLTILNRRNVAELQAWIDLAHERGVRTVGILRPYPIGRLRRAWETYALSLPEMMRALRTLKKPRGLRIMQSWHPNDANCCWQMAAVNAWGDSIGCAYLREFVNYGNVRERPLLATWDDPLYRRLRAGAVSRSCESCSASQGSHGGCRSTAFAFHGRWDAPDPFDEGINDGIDLRILPEWMREEIPRPPAATGA